MNMPAGYDIRKPKMKPFYLGYLNPSDFFCKEIIITMPDLILYKTKDECSTIGRTLGLLWLFFRSAIKQGMEQYYLSK
jgi:hypothetical protein